jgi:cysteinyl-tRNA synthetase
MTRPPRTREAAVTFDVIERFPHVGYEVTYARNFTDMDDKIINRANETGIPAHEISENTYRNTGTTWPP